MNPFNAAASGSQSGSRIPRPSTTMGGGPSDHAGPSGAVGKTDLWADILSSADRQKVYKRKNIILLSNRHHGRRHLLSQLLAPPSGASAPTASAHIANTKRKKRPIGQGLAMGYEVMQVREEGDEEAVPPVSIYFPHSGEARVASALPAALPTNSVTDTAVVIVLDWTKPGDMVRELVDWLVWVEEWAETQDPGGETSEILRERLQAHLQHYTEPPLPTSSASSAGKAAISPNPLPVSSAYSSGPGPLLPLGPGTLTLNAHGIPIVVVCTKADMADSVAEAAGLKGTAWEERCDWIQQVLRTVCLAYGAALFYTAQTQPHTYATLRSYLLHRLYVSPSASNSDLSAPAPPATNRFPFPHRANVLDSDATMVPSGWDSWGKINVVRDGFEPSRVLKSLETSLTAARGKGEGQVDSDSEALEDMWGAAIPDTSRAKPSNTHATITQVEPEQAFLARHHGLLAKDPNRDPRAAFRQPANTTALAPPIGLSGPGGEDSRYGGYGGVVGPMGTGGLSLPGVEKVMAEMEGQGAEDLKEKFANIGRRESTRTPGGGLLSPTTPTGATSPGERPAAVPNEALHNFFQGLLATKGKTSGSSAKGSMPPPST